MSARKRHRDPQYVSTDLQAPDGEPVRRVRAPHRKPFRCPHRTRPERIGCSLCLLPNDFVPAASAPVREPMPEPEPTPAARREAIAEPCARRSPAPVTAQIAEQTAAWLATLPPLSDLPEPDAPVPALSDELVAALMTPKGKA